MIRFVRPSCVTVTSTARKAPFGTGPDSRSGDLSAAFSVRQRGDAVSLLQVVAIASSDGSRVTYRVTDLRTDAVVFSDDFEQ